VVSSLTLGRAKFLLHDFVGEQSVMEKAVVRYDQYEFDLASEDRLKSWKDSVNQQLARFEKAGFVLSGKRVLQISGGPGVLAKYLSENNEVVVTEFSEKTVMAMQQTLGLNAVCYDLNSHDLRKIFDRKFDFLIIESVVNFCDDLDGFISSLVNILEDDAQIFITNDCFSLGYAMSWQFEDYIPSNFVSQGMFLSAFNKKGCFEVQYVDENRYNAFWYRFNNSGWKSRVVYIFRIPFWIVYSLLAQKPSSNLNRKFWSRNVLYFMRYRGQK